MTYDIQIFLWNQSIKTTHLIYGYLTLYSMNVKWKFVSLWVWCSQGFTVLNFQNKIPISTKHTLIRKLVGEGIPPLLVKKKLKN